MVRSFALLDLSAPVGRGWLEALAAAFVNSITLKGLRPVPTTPNRCDDPNSIRGVAIDTVV